MLGWSRCAGRLRLGLEARQIRLPWPARRAGSSSAPPMRFRLHLPGLVDDAHAAAAQLLQQLVVAEASRGNVGLARPGHGGRGSKGSSGSAAADRPRECVGADWAAAQSWRSSLASSGCRRATAVDVGQAALPGLLAQVGEQPREKLSCGCFAGEWRRARSRTLSAGSTRPAAARAAGARPAGNASTRPPRSGPSSAGHLLVRQLLRVPHQDHLPVVFFELRRWPARRRFCSSWRMAAEAGVSSWSSNWPASSNDE